MALIVADPALSARSASLRRMRLLATGLLAVMVAIFLACLKGEAIVPWLAYLRAFAEAGMVGACADWFAVVALFRHPLGIPIPHTAIVPRAKHRIGEALGAFFAGNFFNSAELAARVEQADMAAWVASWLRQRDNVHLIIEGLRGLLPPAVQLIGMPELRGMVSKLIRTGIDSIAAAPLAGRVLAVVVAEGQHEVLFDLMIEAAINFVGDNRETLRRRAVQQRPRWLPAWVDEKLTDRFLDGVADMLVSARAAGHPWRADYRKFLDKLRQRLAHDADTYEWCEQIKAEVLDTTLVDNYLDWLVSEVESHLARDLDLENGLIAKAIEQALMAIGDWMGQDHARRVRVNAWAADALVRLVVPYRSEIGRYISAVVDRWDNETLVGRLELQVGRDLQFIRINGTIVGGLVGLLLFCLTRLLA
ncbi:MAG: DUF445 domain-containing protein [Alphaproteobacteria bacterium]|nr:DUF445 domain-containing protein [Alphaproteobacteria bacterium]